MKRSWAFVGLMASIHGANVVNEFQAILSDGSVYLSYDIKGKQFGGTLQTINLYTDESGLKSNSSFASHSFDGAFIVATLFPDGHWTLVNRQPDDFHQIDHVDRISDNSSRQLQSASGYLAESLDGSYSLCGNTEVPSSVSVASEPYTSYLFYPGCYSDDSIEHDLEMAISSDISFFESQGSNYENTKSKIESVVATASVLYRAQLNLNFKINALEIATPAGVGDTAFANIDASLAISKATCFSRIGDSLMLYQQYKQRVQAQTGASASFHHLLTACSDLENVLGTAFVGTLCSTNYNMGISRLSMTLWRTLAHEVGHVFGASHSFEYGQGRTGGIMDYGNGKLLTGTEGAGKYGMNPLRREEFCGGIKKVIDQCPRFISNSLPRTENPTSMPTSFPTRKSPTSYPTTPFPTTVSPTVYPTTKSPTTKSPTFYPTTKSPTSYPTTKSPGATFQPSISPSSSPSKSPSKNPFTSAPTQLGQSANDSNALSESSTTGVLIILGGIGALMGFLLLAAVMFVKYKRRKKETISDLQLAPSSVQTAPSFKFEV